MAAYLLEWLNLLGRWVHLVTGIAWIGASFYFVWLDNHLQPPEDAQLKDKGVSGELWAVHGGGFYNAQKYGVAPPVLPATLHWFKWEAYTTWITGMFMLCVVYYAGAGAYLIDRSVADISPAAAIAIGLATLAGGWVVYDRLCVSPLGKRPQLLSGVLAALLCAAAYGLCHVFSGRGAFIHFGAMLGTIMVANVFFVIIPGQRELVKAKAEGRTPDSIHGVRGKQRSVHNTYFTLPVLFAMISNHYAFTYGSAGNWAVLMALSVAGALIRTYFVMRHKSDNPSILPPVIATALIVAVIAALAPEAPLPAKAAAPAAEDTTVVAARMLAVVKQRCTVCHSATPTQPGFTAPPKGIALDSEDNLLTHAAQVRAQVASKAMPLGNLTQMTEQERSALIAWLDKH